MKNIRINKLKYLNFHHTAYHHMESDELLYEIFNYLTSLFHRAYYMKYQTLKFIHTKKKSSFEQRQKKMLKNKLFIFELFSSSPRHALVRRFSWYSDTVVVC